MRDLSTSLCGIVEWVKPSGQIQALLQDLLVRIHCHGVAQVFSIDLAGEPMELAGMISCIGMCAQLQLSSLGKAKFWKVLFHWYYLGENLFTGITWGHIFLFCLFLFGFYKRLVHCFELNVLLKKQIKQ